MSKFRRDEPKIRNSTKGSKDRFTKHRGEINKMLEQETELDEYDADLLYDYGDDEY